MSSRYQICAKTIMDTSDPAIVFDKDGVSNHYHSYQEKARRILLPAEERKAAFDTIINNIKGSGRSKTYDCLIGLSGGVDSSYITYLAGELGLKALIVHFDNGWNSELAVSNIEKLINKYGFDLHTLVVDWKEFKDIQLSFFRASVPNIEIVTDHAIIATLYRIAEKYKIKYLISGSNIVTEGILPESWGYDASDFYHIRSIHKRFGTQKFKTFPKLTMLDYVYYMSVKKVGKVNILNYLDYSKEKAISELETNIGWKYYGGKHYESIFTQFFQAYVLPTKFGFDKRRAHLSTLICSGQISRGQALEEMEKPLYDQDLLNEHIAYVLKKWELSENQFQQIMNMPPARHEDYPSNKKWMELALSVKRKLGI